MTLYFENISHSYAGTASVDDISFHITEGEVVTLLGPSGCGKTTLLRLAAGFERPSVGRITQNGTLLSSPYGLVPPECREMGLMFQSYALFPHMTIKENIKFGLHKKSKAINERVAELLAEMNLPKLAEKYPHELSGGEQQRVALARALAPSPSLILLDEPYAGLDSRLRERVRDQMLHMLRQTGTAALMVTHDAEEAMFMSDRIIVLKEGKIMQEGRPIDLYCRPQNAFVAEFFGEVNHIPGIGHQGQANSIFGNFPCDDIKDGQKADIVIRYEALQIALDETGVGAQVMESHLLGRSTLLHLSVPQFGDDKDDLHMHARIPGLNSFAAGAQIYIKMDPAQAFVFLS